MIDRQHGPGWLDEFEQRRAALDPVVAIDRAGRAVADVGGEVAVQGRCKVAELDRDTDGLDLCVAAGVGTGLRVVIRVSAFVIPSSFDRIRLNSSFVSAGFTPESLH